jgi:hypothetical protein
MARGRATEDDLAAGIRRVGVLGAVTAPEGTRRDSPFAAPRTATEKPALVTGEAHSSPERIVVAPNPGAPRDLGLQKAARPSVEAPAPIPNRYTDPVTVPMTAEMRTKANLLAAELQRRRIDRRVRFTANSVFRAAIDSLLDAFVLRADDRADSEAELRALLSRHVCRK